MNRLATIATSLTVAGTVLLGTAAGADPAVHLTSSGLPVTSGGGADYGQVVDLSVTGCLTPGGDPGYVGQFVNWTADPGGTPIHFETITDEAGSLSVQSTTPLLDTTQNMDLTWYCSTTPVTTTSDPNIIWLSPTFDYTIAAAPEGARAGAANKSVTMSKTSSKAKASKTPTTKTPTATVSPAPKGGAVTMTVDPNALPKVDKMGIVGAKAAALKSKVDRQITVNHRLDALVQYLTGRKPAPISNAEYVDTAYKVITGKDASSKVEKPSIARLDAGDLRVQVIEDIALTQHDAAWWNKR